VGTISETVVARMASQTALTNLIGARLYPGIIPQDAESPAVAYQLSDTQHVSSRSGSSHLARSQFQFVCSAETKAEAVAVATAVRGSWEDCGGSVLDGMRLDGAIVMNESEDVVEQNLLFFVRLDIAIWHSEGVTIT
jgi:hypothetical protein